MDRSSVTERRLVVPSVPRTHTIAFLILGVIAVGLATALDSAPMVTLAILGTLVLLAVLLFTMRALVLWQKLTFFALAGFVILSYGFANWTPIPGKPVPGGHLFLLAALPLALRGRKYDAAKFLDEPAILWWLFLVGLSVAHLVLDIPSYGTFAIRDASFVFEGLFMLLGFLWARRATKTKPFFITLALLFLLNTAYSLTYPIADKLVEISPVSGVFKPTPLLGSYSHADFFLMVGGLYYLLVMPHFRMLPPRLTLLLAALQASWAFVFQGRSVYIGTAIALVLLVLFGGLRRGARVIAVVAGGLMVFFVVIGMTGSVIQGRVGVVGPDFLWQHVRSLFLVDPNTPAEGTVQWRLALLSPLRERWTASASVMAIGEGFGQPLLDFENSENVVVRQPHSTHITVLIRLGALGFLVWLLMHWRIFTSLLRFLRSCRRGTPNHDLALWLLLFYVLGVVLTTFQPWLEFSYGAIPFYFFVGFALAMAPRATGRAQSGADRGGPDVGLVAGEVLS